MATEQAGEMIAKGRGSSGTLVATVLRVKS